VTPAGPDQSAEAARARLADRLERYARWSLLSVAPLALIGLVDLTTGWLVNDRRFDAALLALCVLAGLSVISQRRLARRLRAGELQDRATRLQWARAVLSTLLGLTFSAGVGYLIGGPFVAILLPAVTIVLVAYSVSRGLRKRRRLQAERALMQ
jgi:cell division protein FtsL